MHTCVKIISANALLTLSLNTLAAKPTSIVFDANGANAEGTPFASYEVKCSNGKTSPLTAWDNRKKWCLGEASSTDCETKQIKAAKRACKSA